MITSEAFNYISVLDKAADASYKREEIIANNLANATTPGYKRQDMDFSLYLKRELGKSKHIALDQKVDDVHLNHLNPVVYEDHESYSYRLDGNNVDIATENVELASEQLRYQAITGSISNQFAQLNAAMQK